MTCIVGLVHKGKVWLGSDSLGVTYGTYDCAVETESKIFRNGPFIMGYTTSFRMGQLLKYSFDPPKKKEISTYSKHRLYKYMVTDFASAVQKVFSDGKWSSGDSIPNAGGEFLVGIGDRLFHIHSEFCVLEAKRGFSAAGSGAAYALGALHATQHIKDPKKRVKGALEAAEFLNAGVQRPFNLLNT